MTLSYYDPAGAFFPVMAIYLFYLMLISLFGINILFLFNVGKIIYRNKKSYLEFGFIGFGFGFSIYMGYLYLIEVFGLFSVYSSILTLVFGNIVFAAINVKRTSEYRELFSWQRFAEGLKTNKKIWIRNGLTYFIAIFLLFVKYYFYIYSTRAIVFPDSHHWAAITLDLNRQEFLFIYPFSQGLPLFLAPMLYFQPTMGFTLLIFKWLPLINMFILILAVFTVFDRILVHGYFLGVLSSLLIIGSEFFNYRSIGLLPTYYTSLLIVLSLLICCIPEINKCWTGILVGTTILFHSLYGMIIFTIFAFSIILNFFICHNNQDKIEKYEQEKSKKFSQIGKFVFNIKIEFKNLIKFLMIFVVGCVPFFISSLIKYGEDFDSFYVSMLGLPRELNALNLIVKNLWRVIYINFPRIIPVSLYNYETLYVYAPDPIRNTLIYFSSRTGKDLILLTPILLIFPFKKIVNPKVIPFLLGVKSTVFVCIILYFSPNIYLLLNLDYPILYNILFSIIWIYFRDRIMEIFTIPFIILVVLFLYAIGHYIFEIFKILREKVNNKAIQSNKVERLVKTVLIIALIAYPFIFAVKGNYEVDYSIDMKYLDGIYELDAILQKENPNYDIRKDIAISFINTEEIRFLLTCFMESYYTLISFDSLVNTTSTDLFLQSVGQNAKYFIFDRVYSPTQNLNITLDIIKDYGEILYSNEYVMIIGLN